MPKGAITPQNTDLTLRGGGLAPRSIFSNKAILLLVLMLTLFKVSAQVQQTLCQQYGWTMANVTIGIPANPQQSVTFLSTVPTGATYQNQKIRINGILKVDVAFNLNNCTVELEQGAQIVTDGAASINSTNSRYYSCGRMWQGFYIKTAGSIAMLFGEIEDAQAAVTLDDGAGAGITAVLFDRNHIGIRNGSATAGPVAVNLLFFGGNTFDCTSALAQPFHANLSPAYTGTGYAGIYLNTAVGSIPGFLMPNGFQNMHYGIAAENADVSVGSCFFRNMVQHPSMPNSINGIRTSGGALTAAFCQVPFMPNGHGFFAEGTELDVHDNTFNVDGVSGITSLNNLLTDFIYVRNNTLTVQNNVLWWLGFASRLGILIDRNSRSSAGNINLTSFDISGNNLTINGLNAGVVNSLDQVGILVRGPVPSLDIGLISNNIVNANTSIVHRQYGISVLAGLPDRYRVTGNTVTYNDPINLANGNRWAISMLYGTGINHRLQNNTCLALGGSNGQGYCGIHLEDMPNVTMCNNSVNEFEHGIHFFGACNGLGFWQNTMDDHLNSSVRLQDNTNTNIQGFIGTHTRTANRWLLARFAKNNSTFAGFPQNRLILPQNILPFSPTLFVNFGQVMAGAETVCIQPPTYGGEGGGEMTGYDHWVKEGASGASATSVWEAKKALMYKIMRFPELKTADATVNSFYDAEYTTTAGKFAQADHLFLQSVQLITESQNNSISTLTGQRNNILSQLYTLDESNSSLGALSTAQLEAKKALLDAWKANFSNRLALKQQLAAQRLISIQQAQQLLSGIATTTAQESNWKTIQTIRFNRALGLADNETSLNQLRGIAAQCPQTAGSSAIEAIYMLPIEEIAALLPDEQTGLSGNCAARPGERHIRTETTLNTLLVSPNPTKDWLSVEIPIECDGRWEVIDVQGRVSIKGRLAKTRTFLVETAALPEGVYVVTVTTTEGTRYAHKFLVSK